MTARLEALCALIDETDSFIDVGCDHGYAVQYVLRERLARRITACDVSAASLKKAETLLGRDSGVTFVCADGAVAARGYQTVLIGGMGGLETVHILEGCAPRTAILSPQSHAADVRAYLIGRDYTIVHDAVVRDGRKYYDILKATRGGGKAAHAQVGELQLLFGIYADRPNAVLAQKLGKLAAALEKYPPTEENVRRAALLKEAILWQQR